MSDTVLYKCRLVIRECFGELKKALAEMNVILKETQSHWDNASERLAKLTENFEHRRRTFESRAVTVPQPTPAQVELAEVDARLSAYLDVPEFRIVTEQTRGQELKSLTEQVSNLKIEATRAESTHELEEAIRETHKRLDKLGTEVHDQLCRIEKKVLTNTVTSALRDLDYQVEQRRDMLRGELGATCLWAEMNDPGELKLDFSGYTGMTCLQEVARVEQQFIKHGLVLERTSSDFHGRPEGGKLVQKARPLFASLEFKPITWNQKMAKTAQRQRVKGRC